MEDRRVNYNNDSKNVDDTYIFFERNGGAEMDGFRRMIQYEIL